MTMQQPGGGGGQAPPWAPAPPLGYWTIQCTYADQVKSNKAGLEQGSKEFVYQLKQGVSAIIRREPNAEKRLAAYRAKPRELWAEQRAKFPDLGEWWDFRHMLEDWMRLAPVDPVRDAVLAYVVDIEIQRELQGLTEGL